MNTFIILICMINGNKGVCVYVFTKYSFYIVILIKINFGKQKIRKMQQFFCHIV